MNLPYRKKLIEVALPLDAINAAAAREKSIRHGHPSTLHLWWARRPLAACRAILFASLVDDPSSRPDRFPTEAAQVSERRRLFRLMEELVKWENTTNETVLEAVRAEIHSSTEGILPPVLDPFAGGGSIPLEAQRLGLEAHAGDLNPVAVLINKALIEIPPLFSNRSPIHPDQQQSLPGRNWPGSQGLAEDVRYYGKWLRNKAKERIGHLFPKVLLPKERGGGEATVIAWIWARTVTCPNPACGATMPLVSSYILSAKKGQEAWIDPVIDTTQHPTRIQFTVNNGEGKPSDPPKIGRGAKFRCLACLQVCDDGHIKAEGKAGRMGEQLIAMVAEGRRGRIFVSPQPEHEAIASSAQPKWTPAQSVTNDPRNIWCINYGLDSFDKLFTRRQLVALAEFSDLISEVREKVREAAIAVGEADDGLGLSKGGAGATAYSEAVSVYLGLSVSKATDLASTLCHWQSNSQHLKIAPTFSRHTLAMNWDYAEGNPFSESSGNFGRQVELIGEVLDALVPATQGTVQQQDAATTSGSSGGMLISTDPPYYDNVAYAVLSDFFYVWLRHSLHQVYPDLFSTVLVPKTQEIVADSYRHNGRVKAAEFFEQGLARAFLRMRDIQHPDYPLTIYYAFKQSESVQQESQVGNLSTASTGWETMLEGLLQAGFTIVGTWPVRTERPGRLIEYGNNVLASSIVLTCRPRQVEAPIATRREFIRVLYAELPKALDPLIKGASDTAPIAPVDLAQVAIGPGMAIFSRYSEVLEADGAHMRVRMALELINGAIDAYFAHQEGEQDSSTRFCVGWYRTHGTGEGPFGEAQVLSRAVNVDVAGLDRRGLLVAGGGKVRLRRPLEYPEGVWDPNAVHPVITWEATHQLVSTLARNGVQGTAPIARRLGIKAEEARALAYLLFTEATKRGWSEDALGYNNLVVSWPDIVKAAAAIQELQQTNLGI